MPELNLSTEDVAISLIALEDFLDFCTKEIKQTHPSGESNVYTNRDLAKDAIQRLKNFDTSIRVSQIKIITTSLQLLKDDVNDTIIASESQDDINEAKTIRKQINHALRFYKNLLAENGIDADELFYFNSDV